MCVNLDYINFGFFFLFENLTHFWFNNATIFLILKKRNLWLCIQSRHIYSRCHFKTVLTVWRKLGSPQMCCLNFLHMIFLGHKLLSISGNPNISAQKFEFFKFSLYRNTINDPLNLVYKKALYKDILKFKI